jgi:hypothetical protein
MTETLRYAPNVTHLILTSYCRPILDCRYKRSEAAQAVMNHM